MLQLGKTWAVRNFRNTLNTYFEVKLLISSTVVSYWAANGNRDAIPLNVETTLESSFSVRTGHRVPIPESKSGTMAAKVTMRSWRCLRRDDQFWGSFSESVGWGQRTVFPSFVSFSFAATASPSSILASLWNSVQIQSNYQQGDEWTTHSGSMIRRPACSSWKASRSISEATSDSNSCFSLGRERDFAWDILKVGRAEGWRLLNGNHI